MEFNNYLLKKRKALALTQDKLVSNLQGYSLLFKKLDVVTFSRWESGKTLPNIKKRAYVFKYFGEIYKLLPALQDNKKINNSAATTFNQRFSNILQGVDYPYLTKNHAIEVRVDNNKSKLLKSDFLFSFDCNVYNTCKGGDEYQSLIANASSVKIYTCYGNNDFLLGHLVQLNFTFQGLLKIKSLDFERQFHADKLLQISKLKNINDNNIVLIPSIYSINIKTQNIHIALIQEFLLNNNHYNIVIIRILKNEMSLFYQNIGGVIIWSSQEKSTSGVKVGNLRVKWVLIAIDSITALSINPQSAACSPLKLTAK